MDNKFVKILQNVKESEEDQQARRMAQDAALTKIRHGMMTPEEIEEEAWKLMQERPLPLPQISPEKARQLEEAAMRHYNSPEAQAIRQQYDPDIRKQQPDDLAVAAGIIEPRKFQNVRNLLNKK